MSSDIPQHSPSRRAAIFGLLAVSGCGLRPVFGPLGNANQLRNAIAYDLPSTVSGFRMRARLVERLGQPDKANFTLKSSLSVSESPATITTDGDTTRIDLNGIAEWSLIDRRTDEVLLEQTSQAFTSYSATGSTVATQAAQTDASTRLAIGLADLIIADILIAAPDFAP